MHVALCHHALIPPPKYGGTERVIYWLARALVRLGHQVTVVAQAGSDVEGARCVPIPEGAAGEDVVPADIDLLHLWGTPPARPTKFPFVVTVEGNGQPGERFHPNTLFVSRKHAENHGGVHFVYNGLPIEDFSSDPVREDYLVFLAKASWKVKNLVGAIAVARAAGLRLEVLGSRDWPLGLHRYLPAIRGVHYRGMVGDREKRAVLRRARGLLFPVRWHEPFGIAITEALASGCPVFGTPYGSLPEIVSPEVGALSARAADLVAAVRESGRFSPDACRARVRAGFTDMDMAHAYLGFYRSVLETGRLSDLAPSELRTKDGFVSQNLLPWDSGPG